MNVSFNYYSLRARKARLARRLIRKQTRTLLGVIGLISAAGGGLLLLVGIDLGFLLLIPTFVVLVIILWLHGDLKHSPAKFDPASSELKLHEVLDRRVLARMSANPNTPHEIWKSVRGLWRQRFFAVRYGVVDEYLEIGLSKSPEDANAVWVKAVELAKIEDRHDITAASLFMALVLTMPGSEQLLRQLQLDEEDLVAGIAWQRHIELVVERFSEKHYFGGFARDWSAGYTPILNRLAKNISSEIQFGGLLSRDTDSHRDSVDQMVDFLANASRKNVVLVGDSGVGKTTTVYSFAQRILMDPKTPRNLQYQQIFGVNAAALLSTAGNRGELEAMVLQMISEVYHAKNVILYFDNAELFFKEGTGSVDLSKILLPLVERGGARMVFSMTPKDWQTLTRNNASLSGLFNFLSVPEPDEENTMRILEDQVLLIEQKHNVTFTFQALQEAYRLSSRYLHDSSQPGKSIKLMEQAVGVAEDRLVTAASIQRSIERTQGVKVSNATSQEKKQLLNLEDELHQRMINQKRAVSVVSDALRRARSGVGNPNRPVGTFLFLGPTGVGKTELSKALADAFFGGADHIVRVDMNEFVRSEDVGRLIDSAGQKGDSFVAKIRRQPFSVVLLDEIEKAHPDVVNVLLQLLDEGVMKDSDDRDVNFRDAIIIATSNAGADRIREHIDAGEELESFEEDFINELISSNAFKPEFLNRFDEIVLFRPLNQDELVQVVDLLLAEVNKVLDKQKVTVNMTDAAKRWIVEQGYDPRLGARPMRRMMQRTVENVVAKKLLDESLQRGGEITLDEHDLR